MSGVTLDLTGPVLDTLVATLLERDDVLDRLADRIADRGLGEDGYLDVEGAAEYLACKPQRLYALKSAGRIPFHKDGARLLFHKAELREYIRNGGATRP